jgi:DNA polymerase-3 subunit epsilon
VAVRRDPATLALPGLRLDPSARTSAGIRIGLSARPVAVGAVRDAEPRPWTYGVRGAGACPGPEPDAGSADALRALEYVVVDVETTGGSARRGHRVTEVAAVRMAGDGRTLGEFATLVNPDRAIPPFISVLTRITDAMVATAPRFQEIAPALHAMLDGAVFVAHNVPFDWRFVTYELDRAGGPWLRARTLCTLRLARRVVPEVGRRSLDALTDYFGVANEARHRAFGDARATAVLLRRMLDRLEEREIASWGQLTTLLGRRAPRRRRIAMPHPITER